MLALCERIFVYLSLAGRGRWAILCVENVAHFTIRSIQTREGKKEQICSTFLLDGAWYGSK